MNIIVRPFNYGEISETNEQTNNVDYLSIRQFITRARFQNMPLVVVEGKDDVAIYEQLSLIAKKRLFIRPIETIEGYGEGCEHVKTFIADAQSVLEESIENERYLLGIIDRDASFYRGNNYSDLKALLVLNAYSIESHFTTRNHVYFLLEHSVHSIQRVNEVVLDLISEGLNDVYEKLYYFSLEALKNACDSEYVNVIGYGNSFGQIKNQIEALWPAINDKRAILDQFAIEKAISIQDIKLVAKGKWFLEAFIDEIFGKISRLHEYCSSDEYSDFPRCIYCENGIYEKCSWKLKKNVTKNYASLMVYQFLDEEETSYIVDRFALLA